MKTLLLYAQSSAHSNFETLIEKISLRLKMETMKRNLSLGKTEEKEQVERNYQNPRLGWDVGEV